METKKLGELLFEKSYITKEQLEDALAYQEQKNCKLGSILIEKGYISEHNLFEFLAYQANFPFIKLSSYPVMIEALEKVEQSIAVKYNIFPFLIENDKIYIAVDDPWDIVTIDDLKQLLNMNIEPVLATTTEIKEAIKKYYLDDKNSSDKTKSRPGREYVEFVDYSSPNEKFQIDTTETGEILEKILIYAIKEKASAVYIEPREQRVFIRFKIDGLLRNKMALPKGIHNSLIGKLKTLEEKGRGLSSDKEIEYWLKIFYESEQIFLKVKIASALMGEIAFIEIKRKDFIIKDLSELGIDIDNFEEFVKLLYAPRGLLLCTGPSYSGKSTTIYSILNTLYENEKNIVTVEWKPEYEVDKFIQIITADSNDFVFSKYIVDALEFKPDILMVSKIGESLSTKTTLYAAAQGKYIITSYYADSCVDAIYRLMNSENINRNQLAFSLNGIINQRIVKLLCPNCKTSFHPNKIQLNRLGLDEDKEYIFYESKGCSLCEYTGHSGQTGLFQILKISDQMKRLIMSGANYDDIKLQAVKDGMKFLRTIGLKRVISGHISMQELLKSTFKEENLLTF